MPTSARLFAAVCFGLIAWVVTDMVTQAVPERDNWGYLYPVNTVIAALVGWFFVGKRLTVDYSTAMGIGFSGMAAAVFWVLFAQSFSEMLSLALRRRYDGPLEAIAGVFELMIEYGAYLLQPATLATLVVGGMLTGMFAEFVDRRWS